MLESAMELFNSMASFIRIHCNALGYRHSLHPFLVSSWLFSGVLSLELTQISLVHRLFVSGLEARCAVIQHGNLVDMELHGAANGRAGWRSCLPRAHGDEPYFWLKDE